MSEQSTARRSRFTPLRAAQLYDAVLDLLQEVGYEALSMEAVATRARFSKATLYRDWGGKPQLVASAMQYRRPVQIDTIDTGSLRGDLYALAGHSDNKELAQSAAVQLGVGHAIYTNPELRRTLREVMLDPILDDIHAILRRGVDRGEVAPDNPALDLVPPMLASLVIARPLISETPMTQGDVRGHMEALVFPALGI
ncbi:TetR/AcrR family transcriptional regulator [Streptomyces fuscichromogenes]|uniref:TetR family transcriptional regulator n=1 Tax=Streptomyces fuscichromogenes TaxID=1324013 RepID=A0A917XAQ7_9ACTN|nr:TetR/AcrR family transcriptional regulator [Streptomyces fuscichromogenes]GGN02119.1 TetR family transcriptional regulator [Streptomyces fuscichromogenes]